MNQDELEGKLENVKGRVKEAAGTLIGNKRLESEGADERADGVAQERIGEASRKVGEAIEDLGRKIKS
jgi:uncharacterized protein YjbJ (UPF0337 family)